MPEENWAVHGGIPACDSCHSRKVKCDRKDPCANCVNARTACLRTRQKRAPRPRIRTDDKIRALVEKLSSLENTVNATTSRTQPAAEGQNIVLGPPDNGDLSPRPSKRRRNMGPSSLLDLLSPPDSASSSHQPPNEARDFIQKELSNNARLAAHQKSIFKTAIAFVDQLSQSPSSLAESVTWTTVPTDLVPGELVQIILSNQRNDIEIPRWKLHTLDHIPPKALERMAVGLIEGTADERTLNMYKVIVHFKAALGLYASQLQVPHSSSRVHVKNMQLRHLNAALTVLDNASFLTPPSLLLLQTLLTGAVLMHIVGNSASCWSLTAHASRTLIALGYHIHRKTGADVDETEEIHAAVAWCYHFDRLMSLLLLRPPSLPPFDVPVSSLVRHDVTNPMSIFARIMLEMVPIHEKILELTVSNTSGKRSGSNATVKDEVEQLRRQMADVYTLMEQSRPADLYEYNQDYLLHWQSLEFKYFSTLTSVCRLSPTIASDPLEREECLKSARRALEYVKQIEHLGKQQGHFVDDFSPYMCWTILSYPLSPFFVLFCNVVGTGNPRDFQILQDVVDSISSLVVENKSVERLYRLCNTLLSLCKPLIQNTVATQLPDTTAADTAAEMEILVEANLPAMPGLDAMAPWDDEMMGQLFQFQPSLDWFNSDILDLEGWDLNLPT
ncbi:hypothetical protein CC80DRAFT_524542 [Byssothecium circinans]|uniref:Zn(2)-C6 fungal-type domain-containing protein n=1 Tax=Byssothecium circinans TaxID=147558 RepID=A0A6A5U1C6_9PLEO|nr:hypothetical protein CC80DRAFT_524542 [Byssothecium circinans]